MLMKLGEIVVHMDNYNFTKFHQNRMKNKKVLSIAFFSVQNFKVSVESWNSYIVRHLHTLFIALFFCICSPLWQFFPRNGQSRETSFGTAFFQDCWFGELFLKKEIVFLCNGSSDIGHLSFWVRSKKTEGRWHVSIFFSDQTLFW